MTYFNVKGGTHAGWKTLKERSTADWICPSCTAQLRYYLNRCPNTGCDGRHPQA